MKVAGAPGHRDRFRSGRINKPANLSPDFGWQLDRDKLCGALDKLATSFSYLPLASASGMKKEGAGFSRTSDLEFEYSAKAGFGFEL